MAFYNHESNDILTLDVLKIAYDGTHFCGWTGSGHQAQRLAAKTALIIWYNAMKQKRSNREEVELFN
eukprot:scaffold14169_cov93-Cyclotella_meneghiniana.AAC.1